MVTLGDESQARDRTAEMTAAEQELPTAVTRAGPPPAWRRWLPVVEAERLVGLWALDASGRASTFFIRRAERGRGLGDDVVEQLAERGLDLLLPEEPAKASYFLERGYLLLGAEDGVLRLQAPTRVANRRAAASVCLIETKSQHVLIGQRLTPPWPGYWAFPGGKLEPGETALEAAVRELEEETGLVVARPDVLLRTRVYAGGAGAIYAIDNFCIRAPELAAPNVQLPELRPYWVTLDEAAVLRPMAAGTRRVIRKVRRTVTPRRRY